MSKKTTLEAQGTSVVVLSQNQQDIFCLTDIAKFKNPDHPDDVIRNWLRSPQHGGVSRGLGAAQQPEF